MKKKFDIYINEPWERSLEREKNYPHESDPMYWDYVDWTDEFNEHPRILTIK